MSTIVKIEKLIHGGFGVGECDGKKVFVSYAAPGDELEIEITNRQRNYDEGRIIKIIKPSPCRVQPKCPVFGRCGGCQWQHISYEAQIEWKKKILIETLERIGKISSPPVADVIPSPKQWNYRGRIQLHVRDGKVGFYSQGTNDVVEFEECLIADEQINERFALIKDELRKRDRGISIDSSEREGSFVQINSLQNENLKKILCNWLNNLPHDDVVELFAGSGNFTFEIAKIAKKVLASDVDKMAIAFAKKKAEEGNVLNVKFLPASAEKTLKIVNDSPDCLIIDPPRKGAFDILERILEIRPKSIIYVSCEPSTLARDLKALLEGGYKLELIQPIDMFPQTFHIESMSMLKASISTPEVGERPFKQL